MQDVLTRAGTTTSSDFSTTAPRRTLGLAGMRWWRQRQHWRRLPPRLTPAHLEALQDEGLDPLELADVIHGSAFFNWANRLMLSLGEPEQPA